jgi:phosphoenolpyruvate synthase/pyruvate phosphate dikinase
MKAILKIDEILAAGKSQVGGKAFCLAQVHDQGIHIPKTFCIPCQVYETFIAQTHLKDKILLEINRRPFEKMRWEEIWDISLRIRNLFLTTPFPQETHQTLSQLINRYCHDNPVAIRSSAPGEDSVNTSFAGLHESYLNITGTDEILKHVKLVWSSLYSDAALLYRKELGLDIHKSQMAVVIQELIASDRSGVFFSVNPSNSSQAVLESVYGLNQGLVDGDVEPDRWNLHGTTGKVLTHIQPARNRYAVKDTDGIVLASLPEALSEKPPLNDAQVQQVWETGKKLESFFDRPQDVEWTFCKNRLFVLQSRPITSTGYKETDDKRTWYLSLHRSYENLKALYDKIENQLIPQMILEAETLGQVELAKLNTPRLCREINERQDRYDHWVKVYWADFIPFAHGIRLFGQIYNDAVNPEEPYEFMELLENTGLKSVQRNSSLEALAEMIRTDTDLKQCLESAVSPEKDHPFSIRLDRFISEFGDLSCTTGSGNECQYGETGLIRLLLEYAKHASNPIKTRGPDRQVLQTGFMQCFSPEKQRFAADVLHLGRESFRLRDDDNIHLGRIESRLLEAVQEGQSRLEDTALTPEDADRLSQIPALYRRPDDTSRPVTPEVSETASAKWFNARQIVGTPAGPGIATGSARLIKIPEDLKAFKHGEVLICPGVDPNMTFVIPLSAAVVEERGGMLIHGAIIAREYGLPCITGAADIMQLIRTGDQVTVDGYLGIVTCKTRDL